MMSNNKAATLNTNQILDSISDGVFTVDMDSRITSFNKSAENITGIPRKDAIGEFCYNVFKANICATTCYLRTSMYTGKQCINGKATIQNVDGRRIPISISTAPLIDDEGQTIGGAETFRDLSVEMELKHQIDGKYQIGDIISRSPSMQKIFDMLPAIADSASTVLIQGDTGTGKELLARAIHEMGPRQDKPFVALNCGALPDTLLESELFGYKKGAFTGAMMDREGRISAAEGGTLFLDEIGDISPAFQVRLLRFLQERTYEPLGSNDTCTADVRVITATNRNPADDVKSGRFRDDLYYRVNVVKLRLPPLRQRREDIPLLVSHFIERFNRITNKSIITVDEEAMRLLYAYHWPGNIRELENCIEHAFVTTAGHRITVKNLPEEIVVEPVSVEGEASTFGNAEASVIITALERNNYNRTAAARELGIHKSTLFRKVKKLGITLPEHDGRYR